jgi:hypothetical protein
MRQTVVDDATRDLTSTLPAKQNMLQARKTP